MNNLERRLLMEKIRGYEVVTRREYKEILMARMAGGDLYAMEQLVRLRDVDRLLDGLRTKPIYD